MSALPRPPAVALEEAMCTAALDTVLTVERVCYDFPWTRGNFIDSIAAGYRASCLRRADGELLGYSIAMPGVQEMHLLNLTVAPQHQGCGHARTMLEALVRVCRERAAATLWLEVRPSNLRARRLYEQFGFEQVGLRRGYYPAADGRREDALVMNFATGVHGHGLD